MRNLLSKTDSCLDERFSENYNCLSDSFKLSPQLLTNKLKRIFYQEGKLVGGYVINSTPAYQYLKALPQENKESFVKRYGGESHVEITGIWYERQFFSIEQHIEFYRRMALDCYDSGKQFVLGGSHIPRVRDVHMIFLPHLVHEGKREFGGVTKDFWIYFGDAEGVKAAIPKFEKTILEKFNTRLQRGA